MDFFNRSYLTKKRIRTFTEKFVAAGKVVAQGAFQIDFINSGDTVVILSFPQEEIELPRGERLTLPGDPYMIRNDEIAVSFISVPPQTDELKVLFHRVVAEGGDKSIGDNIYLL